MSTEIGKAHVQQFSDNLIHLAQQEGSRLASRVKKKMTRGKSDHFERLGLQTATERTTRHGDVQTSDTPHSRRRVVLRDYEVGDYVDRQDLMRMLIDPRSDYAVAMSNALGRKMDQVIIAAAEGDASSIDAGDSASSVGLAHTIDEDFNTTNSDIIIEKVIEARRILMANEVDVSREELSFVLDSTALHTMLNESEVQSADYNSIKALVRGDIGTFMGFTFIHSEELTTTSEGFKRCLAFAGSGIGLAMGEDITVRTAEIPTKGFNHLVYASSTFGATRIEEEKVIAVEAYRT